MKQKKTEGGNKKGHSNVDHWDYTEVIKKRDKKRRRQQEKDNIRRKINGTFM